MEQHTARRMACLLAAVLLLLAGPACSFFGGSGQGFTDSLSGETQQEEQDAQQAGDEPAAPEVTFETPLGWRPLAEIFGTHTPQHDDLFDADELAAIADPDSGSGELRFSVWCEVMARDLPPDTTLEELIGMIYSGPNFIIEERLSVTELTINGLPATEHEYMQFHGEPLYHVRDTWIETGGRVYILRCKAFPNAFEDARPDLDLFRDSFEVLEGGGGG
ncbi:MAG: hypothetical protein Kow00124_24300 [Anaerolineae bacterium]